MRGPVVVVKMVTIEDAIAAVLSNPDAMAAATDLATRTQHSAREVAELIAGLAVYELTQAEARQAVSQKVKDEGRRLLTVAKRTRSGPGFTYAQGFTAAGHFITDGLIMEGDQG